MKTFLMCNSLYSLHHFSISFFPDDSDDDPDEVGKMGFQLTVKLISMIQICLKDSRDSPAPLSNGPSWIWHIQLHHGLFRHSQILNICETKPIFSCLISQMNLRML